MQDLNLTDPSQTRLVKQPADQIDIPRKFNFAGIYELPFGKGKPFLTAISKPLDYIVGGWELNANLTYMKGWAVNYPNANQVTAGSAVSSNPTVAQWFNTALWNDANGKRVGAQEPFTLRNFPLRFSDVRLPGYQNWGNSSA